MQEKSRVDPFIDVILRYRWLVIAASVLVMVALAVQTGSIAISNDYRMLLHEENPELVAFDALEDIYSSSNLVVVAVAPTAGTVFTRENLGAVEELTDAAWQLPHSSRVDSLTNHFHSEAFGDDLVIEPLVDGADTLDDAGLERVEAIALGTPEVAGRVVSRDGRVAGVLINFILPEEQEAAVNEINDRLDAMLADAESRHPGINYYATGEIIMNRAFLETTSADIQVYLPIALLIMVVVSWVLLRSILGSLSIVLMIAFTVGATMGIAGWASVVLTPISSSIPIVVMALTVAYSVHIVTGTLAALNRNLSRREAIADSLRANIYPIFLTTLTTAVGFLSLNTSELPPFHTLGNFVAIGVVCCFLYSVTLLPALLAVLPLRARRVADKRPQFFHRLGEFVVARRTALLVGITALSIVLISGIPLNQLGDDFAKYFPESNEFRQDTDFIADNLTGMQTQEYSLDSGEEGGITSPEYLQRIDAFAEWYREQPGVRHVWVFSDIMKRLNQNMHEDDPEYYRLPDSAELAAQYLLLYEFSLPFGSDLNNSINLSKSATRMVVTFGGLSTRGEQELAARGYEWLQANAPGLASEAAGLTVVFSQLANRISTRC